MESEGSKRKVSKGKASGARARATGGASKDEDPGVVVDRFLRTANYAIKDNLITTELLLKAIVYRLALGGMEPGTESNFFRIALDCRKQLWTEQGGDSEHRLVLVTKSLDAPPLAEMLNVPPPIETIALPAPSDSNISTTELSAITLTGVPDTTKQ